MKKICIFLISFVFLINTEVYSKSYKELYDDGLKAIKEGGKIIFLRHAYAPRTVENGDNDKNYKGYLWFLIGMDNYLPKNIQENIFTNYF